MHESIADASVEKGKFQCLYFPPKFEHLNIIVDSFKVVLNIFVEHIWDISQIV